MMASSAAQFKGAHEAYCRNRWVYVRSAKYGLRASSHGSMTADTRTYTRQQLDGCVKAQLLGKMVSTRRPARLLCLSCALAEASGFVYSLPKAHQLRRQPSGSQQHQRQVEAMGGQRRAATASSRGSRALGMVSKALCLLAGKPSAAAQKVPAEGGLQQSPKLLSCFRSAGRRAAPHSQLPSSNGWGGKGRSDQLVGATTAVRW